MTKDERLAEALRLLDLINMEWRTDPMSVQCFDRSIIDDVQKLLEESGFVQFAREGEKPNG